MADGNGAPPVRRGPPSPDELWNSLAKLFAEASTRGSDPGLDPAAIDRAYDLLAQIEARGLAPWPMLDAAHIAAPLPARVYPITGFAMAPGPPALWLSFSFGGKSVILQDMMLSLATGTRIWANWTCKPSKVVHIDYEQGHDETIDRYQRLARGRSPMLDIAQQAAGRLSLVIMPPSFLNSAGAEEAYKRALDGMTLAFIDTFAAATPGEKENEAAIGEHIYRLGRVSSATGCSVCVAHHMGKDALMAGKNSKAPPDPRTLARGHTAIFAAAGYVYALGGAKGEPKLVQQVKARGLGDPTVEDFYLELSTVDVRPPVPAINWPGFYNPNNRHDPGGFTVTHKRADLVKAAAHATKADLEAANVREREKLILEIVGRSPGCSISTVKEELTKRKHKARADEKGTTLNALVDAGQLVRLGSDRRARLYRPEDAPPTP